MKVCACTARNWSKCKSLCGAAHIFAFRVKNGSLRIKLYNESVSMITYDCDLEMLFPDNSLIEDKQLLIDFNIFYCVNKRFKIKLFFNTSHSFFDLSLHFSYEKCRYRSSNLGVVLDNIVFLCLCVFCYFSQVAVIDFFLSFRFLRASILVYIHTFSKYFSTK